VYIFLWWKTLSNFIKTKHPKEGENKEQKGRTHIYYIKKELVPYFYHILIENVGKVICLFFILLEFLDDIYFFFPQYMSRIEFSDLRFKKRRQEDFRFWLSIKINILTSRFAKTHLITNLHHKVIHFKIWRCLWY
jgi:hypothetical protein